MRESKMRAWVHELPSQVSQAIDASERSGWVSILRKQLGVHRSRPAVIAGMGGSAASGRLAATLCADWGAPILVPDPELPSWIGDESAVLLVSYSGNTWETLTALETCLRRGIRPAVISSGGELARIAESESLPSLTLPSGYAPRAALGWMWPPVALWLAEILGGDSVAIATSLRNASARVAAEMAGWGNAESLEGRDPIEVGRAMSGRQVYVYAETDAFAPVAYRWKTQIEENAKQIAYSGAFPEVSHNEIEGWTMAQRHGDPLFLLLESGAAPLPRRAAALAASLEELASAGGTILRIPPLEGETTVRVLSQIALGDLASVESAAASGTDPDPVEALVRVKNRTQELAG